jgi:Flp pilus assembly pilin Flp
MKALIKNFITDEKGLETVEYAVMTALIVGAVIVAVGALVTAISGRFTTVANTISTI